MRFLLVFSSLFIASSGLQCYNYLTRPSQVAKETTNCTDEREVCYYAVTPLGTSSGCSLYACQIANLNNECGQIRMWGMVVAATTAINDGDGDFCVIPPENDNETVQPKASMIGNMFKVMSSSVSAAKTIGVAFIKIFGAPVGAK